MTNNLAEIATDIDFSPEEIQHMLDNLDQFAPEELQEIDRIVEELSTRKSNTASKDDLIEFCKRMQPDYKVGRHHRILADQLMALEDGSKDRVCVNIPPRHGKSQLVSIFYPAWFLGRNPNKKVMMVSHTTDLAVDFGRKVRNLIATDEYREIFPNVSLAVDSKSAGRWNTNFGGEYFACGIGSALAGRGADLLLVDDPHSEQDVINGNFSVFDKAYEWFTFGARTRLMPGGRVAIVQTRWHMDDLTGRVTNDMVKNEMADQYEIVEFPALLDAEDAPGAALSHQGRAGAQGAPRDVRAPLQKPQLRAQRTGARCVTHGGLEDLHRRPKGRRHDEGQARGVAKGGGARSGARSIFFMQRWRRSHGGTGTTLAEGRRRKMVTTPRATSALVGKRDRAHDEVPRGPVA